MAGCSCLDRRLFPFPIALQGRGQAHGGSAEAQNEQLDHNTPKLHSAERDSEIRDQTGHEDQGPGDNLVQSGKSRGKSRCLCYIIIHIDHY